MDKKFDLRRQEDREELSGLLPNIDLETIDVPTAAFVAALRDLSGYLGNPDWLTYQWGIVGPLRYGRTQHPFELSRIVRLGLDLRELSQRENFESLLAGFANPPQFVDTIFEAHTASFFSRLNSTKRLRFAPMYTIRGHEKRPEFDVINDIGVLSVECKRPHLHVQQAAETFQTFARALNETVKAVSWPPETRLEVEVIGPLREQPTSLAKRVVESGLEAWRTGRSEFVDDAVRVFLVAQASPFRIPDPRFGHDVMVLGSDEATGLFNPKFTRLRVAHNGLDRKFARSIGARIAQALRQLPEHQGGMIILGDVPRRIADEAIRRRIDDAAYDQVLSFLVCEGDEFHFTYRTSRGDLVERMLIGGQRPLFTPPNRRLNRQRDNEWTKR